MSTNPIGTGARSTHSKRCRAVSTFQKLAKRLECVRLAGAFGSWSRCAVVKQWRLCVKPANGRQVVECSSPLSLSHSRRTLKRQRTGALQDAVALTRALPRLFHRLTSRKQTPLINTPLQRGDLRPSEGRNRFNGFVTLWKTVETVSRSAPAPFTPLKRGVNESAPRAGQVDYEISKLARDRDSAATLFSARRNAG